ncbi:uncharacterized protein ACIBXB_022337 [Morphnus guianensis]
MRPLLRRGATAFAYGGRWERRNPRGGAPVPSRYAVSVGPGRRRGGGCELRRCRRVGTGRVTPLAGRYAECVRWGGAGRAARGHFLPPPFCRRTGGGSGGSCAEAAARPGPAARGVVWKL